MCVIICCIGDIVNIEELNLDIDEIVKTEKSFMKKHNNIYISDEQINILNSVSFLMKQENLVQIILQQVITVE